MLIDLADQYTPRTTKATSIPGPATALTGIPTDRPARVGRRQHWPLSRCKTAIRERRASAWGHLAAMILFEVRQ